MSLALNGTEGVTYNDGTQQSSAPGGKNLIINGDMMIDQRNAGASVTPTNGGLGIDRWQFGLTQASKFTAQQSSDAPTGFSHSMVLTSSSYSFVQTLLSCEIFSLIIELGYSEA